MSPLYPPETKKLNFLCHLEELRKRILFCLGAVLITTIIAFNNGTLILSLVKKPIKDLIPQLIYLGPAEAFTSFLKVCLICGILLASPFILFQFWKFISPAVETNRRNRALLWFLSAFLLLICGVLFSYFIAIPSALNFLLNFGSNIASPQITLEKYLSFFTAFIVIGGLTFEIPIVIGFLADIGLIGTSTLKNKRPMAFLGILVLAAILTPTQDIFNMLVFALPMAFLYEIGVIIASYIENRRNTSSLK